ncbi:hypothetical protein RI054_18g84500 [Pseudoscourfieldia marina]
MAPGRLSYKCFACAFILKDGGGFTPRSDLLSYHGGCGTRQAHHKCCRNLQIDGWAQRHVALSLTPQEARDEFLMCTARTLARQVALKNAHSSARRDDDDATTSPTTAATTVTTQHHTSRIWEATTTITTTSSVSIETNTNSLRGWKQITKTKTATTKAHTIIRSAPSAQSKFPQRNFSATSCEQTSSFTFTPTTTLTTTRRAERARRIAERTVTTEEGRALRRMAPALHGEHPQVSAATGYRPHASRPSWAGAINRADEDEMANLLVAWLREEGYVDCSLPSDAVLALARRAFVAAVVSPDGGRATDAQEDLDAVVGYELHERGLCAGQRKVARAHRNGKTYAEAVDDEWDLEGCRCPPDETAGIDVLAIRLRWRNHETTPKFAP